MKFQLGGSFFSSMNGVVSPVFVRDLLRKMEVVTSRKTIVTWTPLKSYITHEHGIKVEVC